MCVCVWECVGWWRRERSWAGYVTPSLDGPLGVTAVLLHIGSVLAATVCVPASCLRAWHCALPRPTIRRWSSLWSLRLEGTGVITQQWARFSAPFLTRCTFHQITKAPAVSLRRFSHGCVRATSCNRLFLSPIHSSPCASFTAQQCFFFFFLRKNSTLSINFFVDLVTFIFKMVFIFRVHGSFCLIKP